MDSNRYHGGHWKLDWFDDFSSSTIDTTKWGLQAGGDAIFGAYDMYYTTRKDGEPGANAYISDGKLVIEARQETWLGENYTSAMLRTKDLKEFNQNSRIDIRAKLPGTKGLFPAFWLSSQDEPYSTRNLNGEIDIMEFLGHDTDKIYGTLWCYKVPDLSLYSSPNDFEAGYYTSSSGNIEHVYDGKTTDFTADYHIYTLMWFEDKIQFAVDNKIYYTFDFANYFGDIYKPFTHGFYLRINVAVGGSWAGSPDLTSVFPAKLYVDYVKYYTYVA